MRRWLAGFLTLVPLLVASPAPAASTTIVISEFRTRGPNGANDEFIEIFNKSAAAVNITGYKIMMSDGAGNTALVKTIPAATVLQPKRFYLLANGSSQGYSGPNGGNSVYSQSIPDDGGIAVLTSTDVVVDQVGMSAGSAYKEGTPLDPLTLNVNQSYERNFGSCAATKDTDNNAVDFRFNAESSDPRNTGTVCSLCSSVSCKSPPNTDCWDATGTCTNGSCGYTQHAVGSTCSDGNACTVGDACDASGVCVSGSSATCNAPPSPFCSDPQTLVTYAPSGTCSTDSGCSYVQTPANCPFGCDGTAKACKQDPCTGKVCNTPPTNGCYAPASVGVCTSGRCIYTPLPKNTSCTDGDACTVGDVCDNNGTCLAGTPKPTDDDNPCTTDLCNQSTGAVTHPDVAEGTECDDGDRCNGVAKCQSGECKNGGAVVCNQPPTSGCYTNTGSCNKVTGACTYTPLASGASCDDTNPCTESDQCDGNGVCSGSTVACAPNAVCQDSTTSRHFTSGSCSSASGTCAFSHTDELCQFGCNAATGLCSSDPCAGKTCTDTPDQCHVGQCVAGACNYVLKGAGTSCDDGNVCTTADQCTSGGACTGTALVCGTPPAASCKDENTSRQYAVLGACTSGACDYGVPTDVHCTTGCDANTGLCKADPCGTKACDEPPDQCHIGACSDGVCLYTTAKPDASSCDDGNPCTERDVCTTGTCAGEAVTCNTPPVPTCTDANTSKSYDPSTTCGSTGCGTYTSHSTPCPTGCDSATGLCMGNPCAAGCNSAPGACYLSNGACQGDGTCKYDPRAAGVACDDGDDGTTGDACDGAGVCKGTQSGTDAGAGGSGTDAGAGGSATTDAGGASSADASAGGSGTADASAGGKGTAGGAASGGKGGKTGSGGASASTDGGLLPDGGVPPKAHDSGGCGCSVPGRTASTPWALAIAGVLAFAARRRTRRA